MSIIRRKSKTFTVIGNDIVNDKNLTLEALGLLVFMLSKPDNWEFNQEHMGHIFNKGRDSMRSIMKTLTNAGYVQREIQRNEKGHIKTVTIVTENPIFEDDRPTEKPTSVNPSVGEPTPLVNTDCSKDLKRVSKKKELHSLSDFIEDCKAQNVRPLKYYKPLWDYADNIKLPYEYIALAWAVFKNKYTGDSIYSDKKQKNWRQTFLNYLKENYLRLWWIEGEEFKLTTKGLQAQKEHNEQ